MATFAKTSKPSAAAAAAKPKNPPSARTKAKTVAKAAPAILPISDEHRRRYIELAAFYIAERRGFSGGNDNTLKDWLQAEAEIDQLLRQGKINR